MEKKLPDTVYLVTGNNHKGERKPYSVYVQEIHARGHVNLCLALNPNTEAKYEPIPKENIPRGFKTKVIWK